ncbi:MAG: hypothetical protein K5930_01275 [Treponemataceae bacterium]|nr:hypothetical protein [Treponemataceae bacterium]
MRDKIYELLKKINDMNIEKFGIAEENIAFLKIMYTDEAYLNSVIEQTSEEETLNMVESVYKNLCDVGKALWELADMCEDQEELKDVFNKDILTSYVETEEKKDKQIEEELQDEE